MSRRWLSSLLVLTLCAATAVTLAGRDAPPDIDKVGGTILVYEVDTEVSPGGTFSMEELSRAVGKRLDPAGAHAISVRPAGKTRLEVLIPRGRGNHKKDVERVKKLLLQTGRLEFRILANKHDDGKAIAVAEAIFKAAGKSWKDLLAAVKKKWPDTDTSSIPFAASARLAELIRKQYPKAQAEDVERFLRVRLAASAELRELMNRAQKGLPPPPPRAADRKGFKIKLEDGRHQVNYRWVELSKKELKDLKLDDGDSNGKEWKHADKARREGVAFDLRSFFVLGEQGWEPLLYSRPARPGARKKYAYFVLTRDSEPGKAVTGAYLKTVKEGTDQRGSRAVDFRFSKKGADLFGELTTANQPPQDTLGHRHIAIVLDGQVMSAPSLNGVIREAGQISGRFSSAEIETLVNILRAGALPATLKPMPVSEKSVPPSKDGS